MHLTAPVSALALYVIASLVGCGSQNSGAGDGGAGSTPNQTGSGGSGSTQPNGSGGGLLLQFGGAAGSVAMGGNGGGDCNPKPVGLIRDFSVVPPHAHPDFEYMVASDKGIVAPTLGPDKKPVFAGGVHRSVHTAADFDQWYRDTPDINVTIEYTLPFTTATNGNLVYDNQSFFPIDDQGWGNEGNTHNFHFTFELHMEFKYNGGEVFKFRGDDDVFVFVNNNLAIDLGGVHNAEAKDLDMDALATTLGITRGNTYPIDFFQAERHTTKSSFRIETSLAFSNCTPIIVR